MKNITALSNFRLELDQDEHCRAFDVVQAQQRFDPDQCIIEWKYDGVRFKNKRREIGD